MLSSRTDGFVLPFAGGWGNAEGARAVTDTPHRSSARTHTSLKALTLCGPRVELGREDALALAKEASSKLQDATGRLEQTRVWSDV